MSAHRLAKWSAAFLIVATTGLAAQDEPLQKVFEKGDYQAVVQRGGEGRGGAEDTYLAGLAFLKMNQNDGAAGEFRRLAEQGDEAWRQIGASAVAHAEGNHGEAVAAARRATEASGDNPYAQYQLGMAAAGAGDWGTAGPAFARAAELKPDFAYAHYNAGLAYQKDRNLGQAESHLGYFIKLAPNAPERPAAMAILKSLRG